MSSFILLPLETESVSISTFSPGDFATTLIYIYVYFILLAVLVNAIVLKVELLVR